MGRQYRRRTCAPQTTHPSYAKHGCAGVIWCTRYTGTLHRCCTCMPWRHNRSNQRKRGEQLRCGCYLEREIRWCVTLSSYLYIAEGSGPSATDNTPELREDERCKHDNYNGGTIVVATRERRLHVMWIPRSHGRETIAREQRCGRSKLYSWNAVTTLLIRPHFARRLGPLATVIA